MKTIVNLSVAEFNHIICALEMVKREGEYYGNAEQFWSRHEKLYDMLVFERDELKKRIEK